MLDIWSIKSHIVCGAWNELEEQFIERREQYSVWVCACVWMCVCWVDWIDENKRHCNRCNIRITHKIITYHLTKDSHKWLWNQQPGAPFQVQSLIYLEAQLCMVIFHPVRLTNHPKILWMFHFVTKYPIENYSIRRANNDEHKRKPWTIEVKTEIIKFNSNKVKWSSERNWEKKRYVCNLKKAVVCGRLRIKCKVK